MQYKVFNTEQEAKSYSHAEAVLRGVGQAEHTCQYWWLIRQTKEGNWAVQCPEGTEEPEFEDI
jgi:hypothetical protein